MLPHRHGPATGYVPGELLRNVLPRYMTGQHIYYLSPIHGSIRSTFVFQCFKSVQPMLYMVIGKYFDNSLIPVSNTVETHVLGRHHIVKACQCTATGESNV